MPPPLSIPPLRKKGPLMYVDNVKEAVMMMQLVANTKQIYDTVDEKEREGTVAAEAAGTGYG